jgi:hypothetical protein
VTGNFEVIENHIKEYKDLTYLLNSLQEELDDVSKSLKTARKNNVSVRGKNDEVSLLNQKRVELKEKISTTKKAVKDCFGRTEELIFKGIRSHYSEVYEKQLSRLYGYKIDVLVKTPGEYFDEATCSASTVIITKNKAQHKKIVKMLDFGVRDAHTFYTERKVSVEVCVYSKKHKAGDVIPFDRELFK